MAALTAKPSFYEGVNAPCAVATNPNFPVVSAVVIAAPELSVLGQNESSA